MNCKKCKLTIPEGSLYCNYCGAAQKRDTKKKMYQRPDGLFETSKKVDGKRIVFRGKTEHEVMDKMIQYQVAEDTGPLFREVALAWQEETWNNISSNTKKGYSAAYKKALEAFGDMYIKEISTNDVRAYILDFVNKSFAFKTVKNYLLVLHLILQRAYLDEIIPSNPADRVTIPKHLPRKARQVPTEAEMKLVVSSKGKDFGLFYLFLLYTGCRLGEALAIQGRDIDYINKTLSISKSVYFEHNKPNIKEPKTKAGIRTVPIPDILFDELPKLKPNQYLFSDDGGENLFTKKRYETILKQYKEETGLTITPHQLRHGYATLLYDAGMEAKDAQALLGHSTIAMTLDIYTHITNSRRAKSASKLNAFLNTHYTEITQQALKTL